MRIMTKIRGCEEEKMLACEYNLDTKVFAKREKKVWITDASSLEDNDTGGICA